MKYVFLIMSTYEEDTPARVKSICAEEAARETYENIVSAKSENIIREKLGPFNFKFYKLIDGVKQFEEHLYMEKRPVMGG